MLKVNKHQEEMKRIRMCLENILNEMFENTNKSLSVVSDEYSNNMVNQKYQICEIADILGLLEETCQKYGIEYEFNNYLHDYGTSKNSTNMYVFKKIKKEKELVKTNSLYPKYQHK